MTACHLCITVTVNVCISALTVHDDAQPLTACFTQTASELLYGDKFSKNKMFALWSC